MCDNESSCTKERYSAILVCLQPPKKLVSNVFKPHRCYDVVCIKQRVKIPYFPVYLDCIEELEIYVFISSVINEQGLKFPFHHLLLSLQE